VSSASPSQTGDEAGVTEASRFSDPRFISQGEITCFPSGDGTSGRGAALTAACIALCPRSQAITLRGENGVMLAREQRGEISSFFFSNSFVASAQPGREDHAKSRSKRRRDVHDLKP